jgi:hypothetical protein
MKRFLTLLFVMFFALVLVGCGGSKPEPKPEEPGENPENPGEQPEEPETSKLSKVSITGKSSIKVGETLQYTAVFTPSDYADQRVTWTTSDETALSIDAEGKATGVAAKDAVYIYAQSVAEPSVKAGQKKVMVKNAGADGDDPEYPDLGGYEIKIAQAEHALGNFDPELSTYTQLNKEYKLQAWQEVEEDFNCTISVVAYPSSAEWGPSRWAYILDKASKNTSDYDFLTVPDSQIGQFVEGGALLSLEDFYVLHGNNMMDPSFITSGSYKGKLYSLVEGENNIYNVMYYNIGLYEELKKVDPTLAEPAQLFLDGQWTYAKFVAYCKQAQNAMEALHGEKGKAGAETQEYFAISGWDAYWWIGLSSNDGQPLSDINNMQINFNSEHRIQAADVVKELYTSGVAAQAQNVDGAVTQWNDGKALFNTGDLWFVGDDTRWKKDLWGENTKYGYVPWPMPNDMTLDNYKYALGGTACWVMPIGRNYDAYGDDCNAENIYWAVVEMLQRTEKYYTGSATYDRDLALAAVAAKYTHSEASQAAYIYVQEAIEAGKGYYDPLSCPDNPIGSLYTPSAEGITTIKTAVNSYCVKGTVTTWAEATASLVPILQESMRKAFS